MPDPDWTPAWRHGPWRVLADQALALWRRDRRRRLAARENSGAAGPEFRRPRGRPREGKLDMFRPVIVEIQARERTLTGTKRLAAPRTALAASRRLGAWLHDQWGPGVARSAERRLSADEFCDLFGPWPTRRERISKFADAVRPKHAKN